MTSRLAAVLPCHSSLPSLFSNKVQEFFILNISICASFWNKRNLVRPHPSPFKSEGQEVAREPRLHSHLHHTHVHTRCPSPHWLCARLTCLSHKITEVKNCPVGFVVSVKKKKKTTLYHENAFISQYNDISFGFVCEEKKTYKVNLVAITESIWLNSRDDKKWGLQAETSQAILRSKTRDYCFMLKIIGYWPIILPSVDMRRRILIFHWFFFIWDINVFLVL